MESTITSLDDAEHAQHIARGLVLLFPSDTPKFFEIGSEIVVGREPGCDVVLEAGQVSRRHLAVRRNGPLLVAEDLGSRNGSFCDGKPFNKVGLKHQSILRVGDAVLLVWNAPLRSPIAFSEIAHGLFGGPTLADRLLDLRHVAASNLSMIVQGATGCGKERIARAVHAWSGRPGRFVGVNCATIPESLADAQLFGHKRGAFTGAERAEVGYLAAADAGTLFLDEVIDLPLPVQAKLLRALQEREYVPVGETKAVPVDVRVVTSTQKPLSHAVAEGRFREDLLARLNAYEIVLPTLRERREDVVFLFRHFLGEAFQKSPPILNGRLVESLCVHPWPHNVRGLENLARRLGVLYPSEAELSLRHLPPGFHEGWEEDEEALGEAGPSAPSTPSDAVPVPEEVQALARALGACDGNVLKAAQELGISRGRAYRLLAAAGLDVESFRKRSLLKS